MVESVRSEVCMEETSGPEIRSPRSRMAIEHRKMLDAAKSNWLAAEASEMFVSEELQQKKQSMLQVVQMGGFFGGSELDKVLELLEIHRRRAAAIKEKIAESQAAIDAFEEHQVETADERRRLQEEMARAVKDHLGVCQRIQQVLDSLLPLMEERVSAMESMQELGHHLGIDADFKCGIPDSLGEAVQVNVGGKSQDWTEWFLGHTAGLESYVVVVQEFEIGETLARSEPYHFGDLVALPRAQAIPLLSNVRQVPGGRPWDLLPPTLMTVSDFESVQAEAEQAACPVRYFLQNRYERNQEARRQTYIRDLCAEV